MVFDIRNLFLFQVTAVFSRDQCVILEMNKSLFKNELTLQLSPSSHATAAKVYLSICLYYKNYLENSAKVISEVKYLHFLYICKIKSIYLYNLFTNTFSYCYCTTAATQPGF